MNQIERLTYLVNYLIEEGNYDFSVPQTREELFQLYRTLVNVREAKPITKEFIDIQDIMLKEENNKKGIVTFNHSEKLVLWKGDITRLKLDGIVNAANNQMEGCFVPGHHCIDNSIHTYAGVQLRYDCHQMMKNQGFLEPTGQAKITKAYNLPCQYIIHTVGPIVRGMVRREDEQLLASCYESCLQLAESYQLKSIAFCCISTGIFNFPQKRAAQIAVETVKEYLKDSSIEQVVFNVFKEEDEKIYSDLIRKL